MVHQGSNSDGTHGTNGPTYRSHESHWSHSDSGRASVLTGPDQIPAANFARFLVGLACGEPEGRDCGLGVGLLFGLFMAIN